MTEREKAQTISKMISKTQKKVKKEIKVVVAKGGAKGKKGRPKGVKGRYKVTFIYFTQIVQYSVRYINIFLKYLIYN